MHSAQRRFDDSLRRAEEMVYDASMQEYGYVDDQNDNATVGDEAIDADDTDIRWSLMLKRTSSMIC